jgi:hypothetical protein
VLVVIFPSGFVIPVTQVMPSRTKVDQIAWFAHYAYIWWMSTFGAPFVAQRDPASTVKSKIPPIAPITFTKDVLRFDSPPTGTFATEGKRTIWKFGSQIFLNHVYKRPLSGFW